jgi:hypothetical protein
VAVFDPAGLAERMAALEGEMGEEGKVADQVNQV